ncbi:MAG TPA: tetratricopeptide repeat protein [Candidatus Binatia bacterium]|nr:tetratricopeptide repeat protein [Candidatus Binatia bacterium]
MHRPSPTEFIQRMEWLSAEEVSLRAAALRAAARDWQDDVELAMLCVAAGNLEEGAIAARAAYRSAPHEPHSAYAFGVTSVAAKSWADAAEAFDRIGASFELYGQCRLLLALALYELSRCEEAERMTHEALGADDDTYGTLCALRSRCCVALGRLDEAANAFDEALVFSPKLTWVRAARANLPAATQTKIRTVVV